jgi:hypothetical protein
MQGGFHLAYQTAISIPVSWMRSETKYAVMLGFGEIFCGDKSGSGFCPVMGGVERPGNE